MRIFRGVAAFFAIVGGPSVGCTVDDDYRVPTNLELAGDATTIFVGRVEGKASSSPPFGEITVTPVTLLKGQLPTGRLKLPGMIAEKRFAVASKADDLEQAHPLSYMGGCIRYMFVKGSTVLFFVSPIEKAGEGDIPANLRGTLIAAGGPFARWAEDVLTADAPWTRATRLYIAASALPKNRQRAFLIAERAKLLNLGDPDSTLVAKDIDRQLSGPNKRWNDLMKAEIEKWDSQKPAR